MKKFFRNNWPVLAPLLLFLLCALKIHGQSFPDGAQGQSLVTSSPTNEGSFPPQAMVALILPVLVGMLKGFVPERFRKWIPLAMPLLGELITQVLTSLPNGVGAIGGLAGVGVREAVDQHRNGNKSNGADRTNGISTEGNEGSKDGREFLKRAPVVLFCLVAGAASACAILDKASDAVTRPKSSVVTNEVVVYRTNVVAIPVPVPGPVSNVFTTNFVDRVSVVTNLLVVTNTVYEVKPGIESGLQVARVGAAFAPPPYNAAALGGLGILSAGLGYLAARKNRDAASAQKQLAAVITGVESFADGAQGAEVKENISKVSRILGVAAELDASVRAVTAPEKK